jgi:Zn-dependent M16 (insulinase) family peptidase
MTIFEQIRATHLPSLQASIEEYVHPASGARHIHLATDQPDLAFLVAFPTLPDSHNGAAHILEHLVLTGSQRYPVRAPFFSMLRRSTANFMNAMTYGDRTVYPFATTDRNDFFNLLDVYLDATFFPTLDYLNFRQEGWRHTLTDGKLDYQGVVLNEMKGAFADPFRAVYYGITGSLLEGTTYAVESGGDPLAIPELSHQMLKDFHARHYHPSQAIFMTAGRIAATDIQHHIAERVLAALPGKAARLVPQLAQVTAPREVGIAVPSPAGSEDAWGVQLAWILGESTDTSVYYHANLLDAGLLGDATSPLRKAMESAGYGRPSRMNGTDASGRQMLFHTGMDGLREEQLASAQNLLWEGLADAEHHGVPNATLQAALRDIAYRQRDTTGRGMPNVLTRMLNAVPVAMRGGDIMNAFDSEPALQRLRQEIADPAFFKRLVRALMDNPARLDATIRPAPDYFTERAAIERTRLDATFAQLDAHERARIKADNADLDTLQRKPGDSTVLPRILPKDVSPYPRPLASITGGAPGRHMFDIPSNGISYATVQYDVSTLPEADWPWLSLYAALRADLGVADMDYQEAGAWRQRMAPSFSIGMESLIDGADALRILFNFSASGLREEHANIGSVLNTYIAQPRFDELPRIAFLVERLVRRSLDNLGQDGDRYASLAASAPLSAQRYFDDVTSGARLLPFLGRLQRLAGSPAGVESIATHLAQLHARIVKCRVQTLCAGSGTDAQALSAELVLLSAAPLSGSPISLALPMPAKSALYAPSQVNHCHIAWPAPKLHHEQAPALAVAAELLTHQFLYQALREQGGAYGARASYASHLGIFTMSSFRDPRLADTYADFAGAIDRMLATDFSDEHIEEAIICVIKALDRPASPLESVQQAWNLHLRGVDGAARQRYRSAVLACTQSEVKQAVASWLKLSQASRAASIGNPEQQLAGLELVPLQALGEETALMA